MRHDSTESQAVGNSITATNLTMLIPDKDSSIYKGQLFHSPGRRRDSNPLGAIEMYDEEEEYFFESSESETSSELLMSSMKSSKTKDISNIQVYTIKE